MRAAQTWSERSTCQRRHVGVVIAYDGRILVTGYNGAPAGLPHCDHRCDCGYPGDGGLLYEGKHLSNCDEFGDKSTCRVAVHAEANSIAFAAKHGVRLDGAELFTTASPCLACSQLIVNAGIVRVKCGEHYHDPAGMRLLIQADLDVT